MPIAQEQDVRPLRNDAPAAAIPGLFEPIHVPHRVDVHLAFHLSEDLIQLALSSATAPRSPTRREFIKAVFRAAKVAEVPIRMTEAGFAAEILIARLMEHGYAVSNGPVLTLTEKATELRAALPPYHEHVRKIRERATSALPLMFDFTWVKAIGNSTAKHVELENGHHAQVYYSKEHSWCAIINDTGTDKMASEEEATAFAEEKLRRIIGLEIMAARRILHLNVNMSPSPVVTLMIHGREHYISRELSSEMVMTGLIRLSDTAGLTARIYEALPGRDDEIRELMNR